MYLSICLCIYIYRERETDIVVDNAEQERTGGAPRDVLTVEQVVLPREILLILVYLVYSVKMLTLERSDPHAEGRAWFDAFSEMN